MISLHKQTDFNVYFVSGKGFNCQHAATAYARYIAFHQERAIEMLFRESPDSACAPIASIR